MATLRQRAATGAAFLDEQYPDWELLIDAATLDIASGERCILGQLYGEYGDGLEALQIFTRSNKYGFCASSQGIETLNEAWREEIARRRLAHATAKPEPVQVERWVWQPSEYGYCSVNGVTS